MLRAAKSIFAVFLLALSATAAPTYYWRTLPVGTPRTAELVTLFCNACGEATEAGKDIPLVTVLRDTLGENDRSSSKLTAVWLLTYSHPTIAQKSLAAIPFFYWSLSDGTANVSPKDTGPLLDLSAPQHPSVANVERQILQWTALDAFNTPLRATSREYRTNELDRERLHLEEANGYLLQAPVGHGPEELTEDERDFVMARLELRKKLLGGFVSSSQVTSLGKDVEFEQEKVRARNWELLRQCAEKTGLFFEPARVAGSDERYAMLWFPEHAVMEPSAASLGQMWKLLGIKNPYSDERMQNWNGLTKTVGGVKLIPLSFYSLSYPRQPLLLVDFRDKRNLRKRDMTQKSIDEIVSGVVGLSHFTNWYYFVASDVFSFIQERQGRANNRVERLDSYSEFRVAVQLDHELDPALRAELQKRGGLLSSNPLETSPTNEMTAALTRYSLLSDETLGNSSRLLKRIDNQRREELAAYGESPFRAGTDIALHAVTLGKYTHRARSNDENLYLLGVYRRADYDLTFLDKLAAAGTPPEIAYPAERVNQSISELGELMPQIKAARMRRHARATLLAIDKISEDSSVRTACLRESEKLNNVVASPTGVPGILAEPVVK